MAKRFIDTNLFEDEWFCDLSKDAKIFWIYFITSCDHAGCLKLNKKLAEFKTGIKSIDTITKELANRIVTVNEQLLYCPKFLQFQYPGFPNCKFKAAISATKILENHKIDFNKDFTNSSLTLTKELANSYGISNSISNINILKSKEKKIYFQDSEIFDKNKFKEKFSDWNLEKLKYYWEAADSYSAQGNKYIDWTKAIRNWAAKDEKEGKLKFKTEIKTSYPHGNL